MKFNHQPCFAQDVSVTSSPVVAFWTLPQPHQALVYSWGGPHADGCARRGALETLLLPELLLPLIQKGSDLVKLRNNFVSVESTSNCTM